MSSVHDIVLRDATVVDGTGASAYRADIAITAGRIAAVGRAVGRGVRELDIGGRVVAPGFVDLHTHYDAQLLWDPYASPSSKYGFTTVIGGNCGFGIAPVAPGDQDYVSSLLARVEGIPLAALESGLSWGWESFEQWLDLLEGNLAVNAGFLVGHSTLRRFVMGGRSHEAASHDDIAAMTALLTSALRAGALGFSSSAGEAHVDGDGRPVPSRFADHNELVALASGLRDTTATTLQYIAGLTTMAFSPSQIDTMTTMSAVAQLPLNWNVLVVDAEQQESWRQRLAASDLAAARGGSVYALALPVVARSRLNFHDGILLDAIPGWQSVFALPPVERLAQLRRADVRQRLRAAAARPEAAGHRERLRFAEYRVVEAWRDENRRFEGRSAGEIAAERDGDPFDALIDLVVADDLRTVLMPPPRGDDDASWALRSEVVQHPNVIVGGSDAGAHVDMLDSFGYSADIFATLVREHGRLSIENAVRLLTDVPARFYGLRERGQVREGWHADLVVFDPATVAAGAARSIADFPSGARRLSSEPVGIEAVMVNGRIIVERNEHTGDLPGTLLRSGTDTTRPASS